MKKMNVENISVGVCSVCGRRAAVKKLKFSDNFVSYSDLFNGRDACNVCANLIENRQYRMSHWILFEDGTVRILEKNELLSLLRDPPRGSLIYIKSGGRKYGFLHALRFSSTNDLAAVCGEDEGTYLVPREKLQSLVSLAEKAYSVLKRKSALIEGCSAKDWVHEDICRAVEKVRGDPVWRIIIRAL